MSAPAVERRDSIISSACPWRIISFIGFEWPSGGFTPSPLNVFPFFRSSVAFRPISYFRIPVTSIERKIEKKLPSGVDTMTCVIYGLSQFMTFVIKPYLLANEQ